MGLDYDFEIRDKANAELTESYLWYERKQENLGERFLQAVYDKIQLIATDPFLYKSIYKKLREAVIHNFPFTIVYYIDEKKRKVIIIAIFHTSRHPAKKFRK